VSPLRANRRGERQGRPAVCPAPLPGNPAVSPGHLSATSPAAAPAA